METTTSLILAAKRKAWKEHFSSRGLQHARQRVSSAANRETESNSMIIVILPPDPVPEFHHLAVIAFSLTPANGDHNVLLPRSE